MQNNLSDVDRTVLSLRACVEQELSPAVGLSFEIAVSEALTNLVQHAQTTDQSAPILIEVMATADAVTLDIFDPVGATAFDLRDHAKPVDAVDPLAENGRGLGLILQCADLVKYAPKGAQMCLSLSFLKSGG